MIKLLDYYYLVLLRGFGRISVTTLIGFTVVVNLFSFAILLDNHLLEKNIILISIFIFGFVIMSVLDIIYNKNRRERLIEQYKDESPESRQRGVVKVIAYEVLSLAFLIFALSMLERPHP